MLPLRLETLACGASPSATSFSLGSLSRSAAPRACVYPCMSLLHGPYTCTSGGSTLLVPSHTHGDPLARRNLQTPHEPATQDNQPPSDTRQPNQSIYFFSTRNKLKQAQQTSLDSRQPLTPTASPYGYKTRLHGFLAHLLMRRPRHEVIVVWEL